MTGIIYFVSLPTGYLFFSVLNFFHLCLLPSQSTGRVLPSNALPIPHTYGAPFPHCFKLLITLKQLSKILFIIQLKSSFFLKCTSLNRYEPIFRQTSSIASSVHKEKHALTYCDGPSLSWNTSPGTKRTSFSNAFRMIKSLVSFMPGSFIQRNIPPAGTFHSASPVG